MIRAHLLRRIWLSLNGLHLEAKMGDVLQSIDQSQRFTASDTLEAMSSVRIIQNDEGLVDPHIWGRHYQLDGGCTLFKR